MIGHRPARRPARSRGHDSTNRDRLDRCRRNPRGNPRNLARKPAHTDSGRRRLDREYRRRHPDSRRARRGSAGGAIELNRLCRSAPVIPDLMDAMDALAVLRAADVPLALVSDEYGHLDGIVTPGSILAALAGTFAHDVEQGEEPRCWNATMAAGYCPVRAAPTCWLPASGSIFPTTATIRPSPASRSRSSSTFRNGEKFRHDGWSFEIVDMDGRKIDKLIASRPHQRGGSLLRAKSSGLELAEPLLEAILVVAREIVGLLDDPVANDAAGEPPDCWSSRSISAPVIRASCSKRLKPRPRRASANLPDALDLAKVVIGLLVPIELAMNRRARISPVTSLAAAACSPASPRPSGGRFCWVMWVGQARCRSALRAASGAAG